MPPLTAQVIIRAFNRNPLTVILPAIILVLLGCAIAIHFDHALQDSDKVLGLHMTRYWLGGKRFYVDIFEVNPPLVYFMYTLPVMLACLTHLQEAYMLIACVLLLFCVVAWVIQRLIRFHPALNEHERYAHALLLGIVFVICVNTTFFADREYLFQLLVFPYLLRWMPSLRRVDFPLSLRITTGAMAAIGFCLKPYCMIIFFAVQLLIAVKERSLNYCLSLENRIIAAFGCAYVAIVSLCMPEYFRVVVPMALASYDAYSTFAIDFYICSLLYYGITFACFRSQYISPYRADIRYFMGLLVADFTYIVINNGWGYTFYPFDAMVLYVTGWVWLEFRYLHLQQPGVRLFVQGEKMCAGNIALHIACLFLYYAAMLLAPGPSKQQMLDDDLVAVMRETHSKNFGVMSATFSAWPYVARETGARLDTRFHHLWMLPKFLESDEEFRRKNEWILRYVAHGYAEDLTHNKPEIIFVESSPRFFYSRNPGLVTFFSRYPDFAEAWKSYGFLGPVGHCDETKGKSAKLPAICSYDVYRRKDAAVTR